MSIDPVLIITVLLIALLAMVVLMVMQMRSSGSRQQAGEAEQAAQTALIELRGQLAHIAAQSSEIKQTVAMQMHETEGRLGTRLEQSMRDQNERTNRSLNGMAEKLVVISEANAHISALSGQVNELQNILSNKQARGSFGEVQLENLVRDALPDSAYKFQHTLSNGKRVDCYLEMPSPPGAICIDSKFPLESYRQMKAATDDAGREIARRSMESDVKKHLNDIAEKYIVPGETADSAILFLPSESVYAEINLSLPKLVDESRKRRVYMAGPDNLMLILHTVRAILRDSRMHEAAGLIQSEVDKMMQDVGRLDERVTKLATHFRQTERDIEDIQTSTRKITARGGKITAIDVDEDSADSSSAAGSGSAIPPELPR